MSQKEKPSLDTGDYGATVTPVKRRKTRGDTYEDEYTHSGVHIEQGAEDALSNKAFVSRRGERIFYKYPGKPAVMIDKSGAHKHKDSAEKEAEEQAFFTLSMLDSGGYVSNWRQQ